MALLTGMTEDGREVPVQVDGTGRLVAEGLQGPVGPVGPQGTKGDTGSQGAKGDTGATGGAVFGAGTAALPGLAPAGDSDTGIFSPGANRWAVSTGGIERLNVAANGQVRTSLGVVVNSLTQTPHSTLSVVGDAALQSITPLFNFASTDASHRFAYLYHFGLNGDLVILNQESAALRFGSGNAERARITADGKMGVGTTSPSELLTVSGTVKAHALKLRSADGSYWNLSISNAGALEITKVVVTNFAAMGAKQRQQDIPPHLVSQETH